MAMDEGLGDRALTAPEIQETLSPLFEIYDSFFDSGRNLVESDRPFWDLIRIRRSKLDSPGLRTLLNLRYFAEHYRPAWDAELLEGFRDSVIPLIESNPSVVTSVFMDEKQLMRESIIRAYVMFIDPFGTEDALRRYKAAHDDFRELSELLDTYFRKTN